MAARVQLPPGHPLVQVVLLGSWLRHEGAAELYQHALDPKHRLHSFTPPQVWLPSWESPGLHPVQPVAPCSGAGTSQTCRLSPGDATGRCHPL